jgi:hypothetical protein
MTNACNIGQVGSTFGGYLAVKSIYLWSFESFNGCFDKIGKSMCHNNVQEDEFFLHGSLRLEGELEDIDVDQANRCHGLDVKLQSSPSNRVHRKCRAG